MNELERLKKENELLKRLAFANLGICAYCKNKRVCIYHSNRFNCSDCCAKDNCV